MSNKLSFLYFLSTPFAVKLVGLILIFFSLMIEGLGAAELNEYRVTMDDEHQLVMYSRIPDNPREVILLIHGRTWSALPDFDLMAGNENLSMMQALAKQGFAVYAVDLRGYGKTPRDESGWNTPNRAAKDVAILLDDINQRHPELAGTNVFGWSYGSMVAMLTAQRYPDKVKTLILYGFPIDTTEKRDNGPNHLVPPRKKTTAQAAAEDFILPGTISKAAIDAYVSASLAADPIRMDWNQLAQWNQLDGAKVTVPTLLLQAEADPYVNWDADAVLFKRLANQNKQWVVLANADHAALLETARFRLYDAVINFVEWTSK
ncbi:lysophospholipase [Aliikangiella marina]|uniref:Lysophospholipase n=1 Tax=Aliikangiella marina TaxID=1712262 RepID=A0A545THU0_9GAMM|nr:alpha/beta fold hydrolase [Aliikangiella marina]TQV76799.1 lysophospholipase [Aliikangiella marina]